MTQLATSPSVEYKLAELDDLEAEMVRLLQQFMGAKKPFHGFTERSWRPPTDIYETADSLIVTIEIAGVDKDALTLEFKQNVLTVSGDRHHNPAALQVSYHQMEIKYGPFEVELRLPAGLDSDDANARYADGFLAISIPKREPGASNSVDIEIER